METISIAAKRREIKGKQVKQVRSEGDVPAVVYGHGFENMDISVDGRVFDKVLSKAGESTLIELSIDGGESLKVLVHEVQRHPLKGQVTHIDFRQVQMSESWRRTWSSSWSASPWPLRLSAERSSPA